MEFGYYNIDCMDGLKQLPDKSVDLAIVDPPYGDGGGTWTGPERFGGRFDKYKTDRRGGGWNNKYGTKIIGWDTAPGPEYFAELFRVSKHAIIWGGNYFDLPPSKNFIIWRKLTITESFSMAMAEYAWTDINGNAKVYEAAPQGTKAEPRFHPTQKPVALYKWLLHHYANPGDVILDTHVGSASSLIACEDMGFNYYGFEIDEEYYNKGVERLQLNRRQIRFDFDQTEIEL